MIVANEFARPVRLDALGEMPREIRVEAESDERDALARRFGLLAVERLAAMAAVRRAGDAVFAEGRIEAAIVQACVATGEPVPAQVSERFALRFEPAAGAAGDEVELAEGDLDVVPYSGGAIDLGEAAAETLGLALDPFPRAPDADERLREAGVTGGTGAAAFAALGALRARLEGG